MATNKHAIIRYRTLDKCFSNRGRKYYLGDLLEACNAALAEVDPSSTGIKKRQLYDDIAFMEREDGYSIELDKKKDGREVYYRYVDPNFTIKEKGLNSSEASQINEALQILARFKGMPQFEWVDELAARLESSFGLKEGAEKLIDFEQNKYLRGLEHITTLFNASLNKRVCKIKYKPFKRNQEQNLIFHPYYLKQYNNRWFCFGWNEELKKISNLALDRIIELKEIKKKHLTNTNENFDEYFEDIVGVTAIGAAQKVILKVDSDLYPYIETKPLHGSQKVVEKAKDYVVLSFELKLNYELESLILSHGEKIEILEPNLLKTKIKDRLLKASGKYR